MVWLDGLDIPMVRFLDAGFAENATGAVAAGRCGPRARARALRPQHGADATRRAVRPADLADLQSIRTSAAATRWRRSRAARRSTHWLGVKLRYVNPATGALADADDRRPSCSCCRPASRRSRCRSTDGAVYACLEGDGAAEVGGRSDFDFEPRDIFVVPSWQTLRLQARRDCVLFSFSDRPVQQALGLWREEKLERA